MNCKNIQELILTDYIDNEASEETLNDIKNHLSACIKCREFEAALKQKIRNPLKKSKILVPPERVWLHIKNTIEAEDTKGFLTRLKEDIVYFLNTRKTAFAVATVTPALVIAFVVTRLPNNNNEALNTYIDEQADFLSSLDNEEKSNNIAFDTAIEEFFL